MNFADDSEVLGASEPAPQGEYSFAGLPPGQYEILSSYQIRNPEMEGWTPGLGASITLEEGQEETLDLSLSELDREF